MERPRKMKPEFEIRPVPEGQIEVIERVLGKRLPEISGASFVPGSVVRRLRRPGETTRMKRWTWLSSIGPTSCCE